jgi:lipoate-protein ligase A
MAVDELLLEEVDAAGAEAAPCLRLYAWDRPTLSLGYFQSLDEMPAEARDRYAVVRRTTGGGAILHDREVTYSVAVRRETLDGAALYDRVNRALVLALSALGAEVTVRGAASGAMPTQASACESTTEQAHASVGPAPAQTTPAQGERGPVSAQRGPFFCFARAGATDIIAPSRADAKLAGGAQRRWRSAVLQHGSVMLEADEPGAIGLRTLLGRAITFDELAANIIAGFEREFDCAFAPGELSAEERRRAEAIRRERYASDAWLARGHRKGSG